VSDLLEGQVSWLFWMIRVSVQGISTIPRLRRGVGLKVAIGSGFGGLQSLFQCCCECNCNCECDRECDRDRNCNCNATETVTATATANVNATATATATATVATATVVRLGGETELACDWNQQVNGKRSWWQRLVAWRMVAIGVRG